MLTDLTPEMIKASWQTLYMLFVSGSIAILLGLPLGVFLFSCHQSTLAPKPITYRILCMIVNALRSIPFIILLVALVPITRFIVGTSIGTTAAIVPLTIGAIPFVARLVENALMEIPKGLIETGLAMGASSQQIIRHILLPEAWPSIINNMTVMFITLLGFSAMAGAVGGGGLGDLAIRYGYQRFNLPVMLITIVLLLLMVQIIQWIGDKLAGHVQH